MSRIPANPDPFALTGCFIAGGAILSIATKTDINDYDVYPKSSEGFADVVHQLEDCGCFVISITDRAITYKSNTELNANGERSTIQVIMYDYFKTPEDIFENFDFTVCMGAYDTDSKSYIFHEDFYPDIATSTLRFNHKTRYPLNSLLRTSKYRHKGFHISKPEHTKLALAVANAGMPQSWEDLESQIGGTYGREIELAREGIEFNYANAIELLSNIDFAHCRADDHAKEYSRVTADDIVTHFVPQPSSTINVNQQLHVVTDSHIEAMINPTLITKFGVPDHFQTITQGRLSGYVTLIRNKDGLLMSPTRTLSNVTYNIGEEASVDVWPHLSVSLRKPAIRTHHKDRSSYLVSFDISDIADIRNNEAKVAKVTVESEVVDNG